MQEEVREAVEEYAGIGIVMTLFTALVRPFISVRQTIRDSVIVFVFTILAGVTLEGFDISPYFKLGFSGCVGFWAVRIYEILKAVFAKVEQNPDMILDNLESK